MGLRSMTGFGVARRPWSPPPPGAPGTVHVEVRSVNARFREIKIRQPFGAAVELALRKRIERRVGRGRVELKVQLVQGETTSADAGAGSLVALGIDPQRLPHVLAAAAEVARQADDVGLDMSPPTALEFLRFMTGRASAGDVHDGPPEFLDALVDEALEALATFREREGVALQSALEGLAAALAEEIGRLRAALAGEGERMQKLVTDKAKELCARVGAGAPDAERVAQEVAMLAGRADVAEELARINSHLEQMTSVLTARASAGQGKTLDFLCQELLREVSTIGGKISSHTGSGIVIEAKGTIERIREQVQNVE